MKAYKLSLLKIKYRYILLLKNNYVLNYLHYKTLQSIKIISKLDNKLKHNYLYNTKVEKKSKTKYY